MIRSLRAVAVVLVLAAAGCGGSDGGPSPSPEPPAPFTDCAALTAPPPAAEPVALSGEGKPLPEVALPCFTGDQEVTVSAIRGPAVVNLWGSWCPPCREELPAFQRFADRAAGKVTVIGVDTRDSRSAAGSLAADLGLTYPNLFDPDERLRVKVGVSALPATLFVDRDGRVRHLYNSTALDDATLATLVARHLGVTLP
ncbi:TlpA disulfide reductase family protein [Phytohabitans sp. ZYX-F-186]|uniref:TlpA disulfide reductase family protein n=1 Tax=Phytohabitans maris TaxID=3071409 RepID=A0ABU0ZIP1_9ACTN|nr:TlpA disulfide reductase family protein [Phytohabitans sp. ZYX-F-186]MDQ7906916.1 TlpA disulfide reductase family protein [Phytohabitans sp. ZYX-F-186]